MTETPVSSFCLLSLPENALHLVLWNMRFQEIFAISLISQRIKLLVRSLTLKPVQIEITVKQEKTKLYVEREEEYLLKIKFNESSERNLDEPWIERCSESLEYYVAHLLNLLPKSIVSQLVFRENLEENKIRSIFQMVPNCETLMICQQISNITCQQILNHYSTNSKHVILVQSSPPPNILLSGLDSLTQIEFSHYVDLDCFLMTNCVSFGKHSIDPKTFNKFLKLWIQNKSNPRLEYFFATGRNFDMNMILNGIKNTKVADKEVRFFKNSRKVSRAHDWFRSFDTLEVKGGYDLMRKDGRRATIVVSPWMHMLKMEFIIHPF